MSWKFAGIIIEGNGHTSNLPASLGLKAAGVSEINLSCALAKDIEEFAYGEIAGRILLLNRILPFEADYGSENKSALDQKIIDSAGSHNASCFYVNGTMADVGFNHYVAGKKHSSYRWLNNAVNKSFGLNILADLGIATKDPENAVLGYISKTLELTVSQMFMDKSIKLRLFEPK